MSAISLAEEELRLLNGSIGVDAEAFGTLEGHYRHLNRCHAVATEIYAAWRSHIDNLMNEIHMEAVPAPRRSRPP